MKSLAVLAMATLLLALFFQCCPSALSEAPPVEVSTEPAPPPASQAASEEEATAPPPAQPTATQPPPPPVTQSVVLDFSGHGNEATEPFGLEPGLIRCDYAHDGEWNFIVYLLDEQGEMETILANEIGECEGSSADTIRSAGDYLLSVTGDGTWNLVCEATGPGGQAATEQPSVVFELSGLGNEASGQFPLNAGLLRCDYAHDGEWNFIVYLLDEQGEMETILANEIGECEGSSATGVRSAGNYLLDVTGDGNWSITLSQ